MSQVATLLDGGGGTGPGEGATCVGGGGGGRRKALVHNNMIYPRKQNTFSHTKHGRKRIHSQPGVERGGKFHIPHKKRRKDGHIPPTKFLLGGNICDPLNLGSLQDEEINRAMNAVTPRSSPLPTPKHRKGEVEVIIPPNINDPLNLNSCEDEEEYMAQLANSGGSPLKKTRNKSKRKKKRLSAVSNSSGKQENAEDTSLDKSGNISMTSDNTEGAPENDPVPKETIHPSMSSTTPPENAVQGGGDTGEAAAPEAAKTHDSPLKRPNRRPEEGGKERRPRKVDQKDKIVSPVVWQPARKHPHGHGYGRNQRFKGRKNSTWPQSEPKFRTKDATFQYGNFDRYYGYRNPSNVPDLRLKCFAEYPELFRDRDVLDIGCNVGHITLSLGRDFRARSVVGIDIDRKLIEIARKNVRHYVNYEQSPGPTAAGTPSSTPSHSTPSYVSQNQLVMGKERTPQDRFFPISMPIVFGPIEIPGITDGIRTPRPPSAPLPFPKNISFIQGNYVLDSDSLLALEQPQFDAILCLSITKWFHLNWGDAGLKRAFKRMFLQLRPGGCLILEPQGWPTYNRKKKLTETIWKNFNSIEFFPHQFREYLLSPEVGFSHCRILDIPQHAAKGFCRPITMFVKGDPSPVHSTLSMDSSTVLHPRVYAQTTCDDASPMSDTPDASQTFSGTGNLPGTSPSRDATRMPCRQTPKYQFPSPDHPTSASPPSGGCTPDPRSASPPQRGLPPDNSLQAGLTPDPGASLGSLTPDPNSTSPFPMGQICDGSVSPASGFGPDMHCASGDLSDGEGAKYVALVGDQSSLDLSPHSDTPEGLKTDVESSDDVCPSAISNLSEHKGKVDSEETEILQADFTIVAGDEAKVAPAIPDSN